MISIWTLIKAAAYIGMLILLYGAIQGTVYADTWNLVTLDHITPKITYNYSNKTFSDGELEDFARFMMQDETKNNHYINGSFECMNFAMGLLVNASKQGFYLYIVNIRDSKHYPGGHYVNGFRLVSGKCIIIEPQTGEFITQRLIHDGEIETVTFIPREAIVKIISDSEIVCSGKGSMEVQL